MSARDERARRVFDDSRATLRDVGTVLAEFEHDAPLASPPSADPTSRDVERTGSTSIGELVHTLHRVYGEIIGIVESLRESRSLLERAAVERLQRTHAKLREVSSATEVAATGMLDGLDRALELVDRLEAVDDARAPRNDAAAGDDAGRAGDDAGSVRDELREELHAMVSLLQFQDITAQQLGHASGVLEDIESRLLAVARIFDFDLDDGGDDEPEAPPGRDHADADDHGTCDPDASTLDADSRQAVADEIFTSPGTQPRDA